MPEDRSLDEFGIGDDAPEDDTSGSAAAPTADADVPDAGVDADATTDTGGEEPAVDPAEVAPAEATFDHSPDGAACAACGATVTRRWRDDPGYVCEDCKEW